MTDARQVILDVLQQHSRRTDPNHPCWPKCRCGFDPEAFDQEPGGWPEHVTDYLLATLRNLGIGFAYANRTPNCPKGCDCSDCYGNTERTCHCFT